MPRRPRTNLRIEPLEDRTTPAVWGNPWPEPGRLTLSFAPDGTTYPDGTSSSLFATLNKQMTPAVWQGEFVRAAQAWAAVSGINISVVPDTGAPFGQAGPVQGSSDYGDIRVGARPLAASSLIVTTPFDLLGPGAGDIAVNSGATFTKGGSGGVDLYTAALQEVGHALGLGNSPDTSSAMYTVYTAPRAGLGTTDVSSVQALYGPRAADRFEGKDGNNTFDRADPLTFATPTALAAAADPTLGSAPLAAAGDITTAGDVDYYKVQLPSNQTSFQVQLRTAGVSSLVGRVTVTNDKNVLVQSAAAADPRTGDVNLSVTGARAGGTYLVRVEAAGAGYSVGGYRLAAGTAAVDAVYPEARTGWQNPDNGKNDTLGSRTDLGTFKQASGAAWEITNRASIESATDRDFYKVKVDKSFTAGVVVIGVWATEVDQLDPVVRVYDKNGVRLAAEALGNDRSGYTVQLTGVAPDSELTVEVAAANPADPASNTGNYFIAGDLRQTAVTLAPVSSGTLTSTAKQWAGQFVVDLPRTYHFTLALGASAQADAAARVTIYDASNQVVASFLARPGETVGTDVPLGVGLYTVKVSGGTQSGAALAPLAYNLRMLIRDDPIGPQPIDPTGTPTAPPTSPAPPPVTKAPTTWVYFYDAYSDPWFGV